MHGPDGAEVPSAANAARTSASVSVVVPMLDAGPRVDAVHAVLSELVADSGPDAELILVDDASTDDTWRRIQQLAVVDPRVVGLRLQRNVGQTSALCAGFSVATGRSVVIMDDDVECGPEDLRRFVAAIDAGADFASGWRRGWRTPVRSIGSKMYNRRLRSWGLPFHDAGCGANAMTLDLAQRISQLGWGVRQHRFKPAVAQLTDRIVEVPFEVRPTTESHHGLRSLALSWLDVELHFGPLSPAWAHVLAVGVPGGAAVALVGSPSTWSARTSRRLARLTLALTASAVALLGVDMLRRWAAQERRERVEPAFVIAERTRVSPS